MILVFVVTYRKEKEHSITEHQYNNFGIACEVVAEVWSYEPEKVYTIVDTRTFDI